MKTTEMARQLRILVVEDEALVRLELAAALTDAGFDVTETSNADEAVAVLSAFPDVALMITDVELFGSTDGVKLSWIVRRRWPPIEILVISGRLRADELELPEGCKFFSKPYGIDRLISTVQELLS